jgi:hypothetical protein
LIAFARHQWKLASKAGDGASLGDHLKALERRGIRPAASVAPKLPKEAAHIWAAYCQLDATRASGFGPGPILFTEIEAFLRVTGVALRRWEIMAIRAIDMAYMQHYAEAQAAKVRS